MTKQYILFAGVNGAGKTTLFQTYPDLCNMPRVNVDEIVRQSGDWKNPRDVIAAGITAVRMIETFFNEGVSFNQETTLCGKSIIRNIHKAKKEGFEVVLYYVGLDCVDTAKKRVAQRVLDGGHGIPDKDIERRYNESLCNLELIIPVCDRVEIFDNTRIFQHVYLILNGKCMDYDDNLPDWCKTIINNTGSKKIIGNQ